MPEPPSVHGRGSSPSSFNGIKIDVVSAAAPAPNIGESGTYTLLLRPPIGLELDETGRNSPMARYQTFLEYAHHAGQFEAVELDDGTVMYTEETPASFDHSLLVRFELPEDSTAPSRYGLLERVEPTAPPAPNSPIAVDVDLLYLAPLSAYQDRADLRNDLEFPGL